MLASAVPATVSAKATGQSVVVPSDTEEDNTEDEASAASTAQDSPAVAETPSLDSNEMPAGGGGSNKIVLGIFTTVVFAHLLRLYKDKKNKLHTRKEPKHLLFIHQSLILPLVV